MKRLVVAVIALIALAGCNTLITTPPDGDIVPAGTMSVSGEIPSGYTIGGTLTVNGATTTVSADRKWTTNVATTPVGSVTVVTAIYTEPNGTAHRQRSAVVVGPKLVDGQYSPNGVGMRFTNTGLANLGPVINSLAGGSFDISALIMAQDPLIPKTDAGAGTTITGKAYEAGSSGVTIAASSAADGVKTHVTVGDLYLGLDLQLGGLISGPCKLEVQIPTTTIDATFDLKPAVGDESHVDVNLVGAPVVATPTVNYEFISGVCDPSTPLLGSIINSLAGSKISGTIKDGFSAQLGDPDGAGPADSPIADAIETALSQISIAGSVGDAVKAHLDAPFTQINETATGIDFRSNADFYNTIGSGAGDCSPPPGTRDLKNVFDTPGVYPTLGGTTPSGQPYGLGLVISSSSFNQLLGAMTECGLLNQDITEISLGGPATPITSTLLSALVPAFATALPANTPMLIRVNPYFSPFLSGAAGPNGEPAELTLADLHLSFIQPTGSGDVNWLTLGVDAPLGFDLGFDQVNGVLAPTISPPVAASVTARVIDNKVGANEAGIETLFPNLFPSFVGGLSDSFGAFPLPEFLGLKLNVAEVARQGNSYVLYANLNPALSAHLANVAITDLSTPDYSNDSAVFDSWEWRHRVRKQVGDTTIKTQIQGMMGADACCTVDDERDSAHAGGRIAFTVVPAGSETWKVDIAQSIAGAHTTVGEGVGGGYGAQTWITPVSGRYKVGSGAWVNFGFSPDKLTSTWRNSDYYLPFSGASAASITGTGTANITVEYGFDVEAFSDSNWAFPAEAGNEAAVRFGANDSLTNNFTAGDYPGVGNRAIANDGHRASVTLTTLP